MAVQAVRCCRYGESRGWDYDLVEYGGECDRNDPFPGFPAGCGDTLTIKVREPRTEGTEA